MTVGDDCHMTIHVSTRVVAGKAPPKAQVLKFGDETLHCVQSVSPAGAMAVDIRQLLIVPEGSPLLALGDDE